MHTQSAKPIGKIIGSQDNNDEKATLAYGKKAKRKDLLNDYVQEKTKALLINGYDSSTSPNSGSVNNKLIVDTAFVRPIEPNATKTTVQEVINGVPSGYTSSPRRAMAEAIHLARLNPEHEVYNYKMLQKEYEHQVMKADIEENEIIEMYREEQIHKELLISTLEGEIQMIANNATYIQEVQDILDACAFREKVFLQGLKKGKPGDDGRDKFLNRMLKGEQDDTLKLSKILDHINEMKNNNTPKMDNDNTGNNENESLAVSEKDNTTHRSKKSRRKSKFMEFRDWHNTRSPSQNKLNDDDTMNIRKITMAEIQYKKEEEKDNSNINIITQNNKNIESDAHDDEQVLVNKLSDQVQGYNSNLKNRNNTVVRISKAIEKLTRLMENQSGKEIILSNAHCKYFFLKIFVISMQILST